MGAEQKDRKEGKAKTLSRIKDQRLSVDVKAVEGNRDMKIMRTA